jgi:hypothetical protein
MRIKWSYPDQLTLLSAAMTKKHRYMSDTKCGVKNTTFRFFPGDLVENGASDHFDNNRVGVVIAVTLKDVSKWDQSIDQMFSESEFVKVRQSNVYVLWSEP